MKISFTQKQRIMEGITVFTIILISIYVAFMWGKLPQEVPSNFGINGEITKFSSKSSIGIKLAVTYGIYIVFTIITINPSTWGIGGIKNKKNQQEAFVLGGDLFCFLKLILVSIMSYIIFCALNFIDLGKIFIPMAAILPLAIGFNTSAKLNALKK